MQVLRKFSTSLRERAVIATTANPDFTPTSNDRCARGAASSCARSWTLGRNRCTGLGLLQRCRCTYANGSVTPLSQVCCSNRAMLKEAGAFSVQMHRMEQDLRTLSQAAQVSTLEPLASMPCR